MNIIRRRYSTIAGRAAAEKHGKSTRHIYEQNVFGSWEELVSYLNSNIIYSDKKLLMINKPYALRKEPLSSIVAKNRTIPNSVPIGYQTTEVNFTDAISHLTKDLQIQNLELVKVPERYISGVSILSGDPAVTKKVKNQFGEATYPISTYLAVCFGIPLKETDSTKLGFSIVTRNDRKKAIFMENYSRRSVFRRLVYPAVFKHQTLSINEDLNVSLIRIENNRNKWHSVRAYCALRLLAPVLGDTMYSSCVRILSKKLVPIDPFSDLASFPLNLPENIISKLRLRRHDETIIPSHLHLAELNFQRYYGGMRFVAKVPDYFLWTCDQLNLTVPEDYQKNWYQPLKQIKNNKRLKDLTLENSEKPV